MCKHKLLLCQRELPQSLIILPHDIVEHRLCRYGGPLRQDGIAALRLTALVQGITVIIEIEVVPVKGRIYLLQFSGCILIHIHHRPLSGFLPFAVCFLPCTVDPCKQCKSRNGSHKCKSRQHRIQHIAHRMLSLTGPPAPALRNVPATGQCQHCDDAHGQTDYRQRIGRQCENPHHQQSIQCRIPPPYLDRHRHCHHSDRDKQPRQSGLHTGFQILVESIFRTAGHTDCLIWSLFLCEILCLDPSITSESRAGAGSDTGGLCYRPDLHIPDMEPANRRILLHYECPDPYSKHGNQHSGREPPVP